MKISETHVPTTPKIGLIDSTDKTTPLRGDQQDLVDLQKIMEEDLKGLTKEEKIKIVSPGLKVGTNSTNIYRGIVSGTRKDSPASKCVENYRKWEEENGPRTKRIPFSFEEKEPKDE